MQAWLIWLIAAVALLVAELFSLQLVLVMFSLGAFAASIAAGQHVNLFVQSLIFAGVSVFTLILVRPVVLARLHRHSDKAKTGIDALIGAPATVLKPVNESGGLVKVSGEDWSAQAVEPGAIYQPGEKVFVVEVKGAIALVSGEQK